MHAYDVPFDLAVRVAEQPERHRQVDVAGLALVEELGQAPEDLTENDGAEPGRHHLAQVTERHGTQHGRHVDRVELGRVHRDPAGAGHAEDATDTDREAGVPLDVERAGEVLQPGVALAADQPEEADDVGGEDHVDRLVDGDVRARDDLTAPQLDAVPLEQLPLVLQVEPDHTVQEGQALGDGVLVEPGEDHLDRHRPDLVAPHQREEVVVGRGMDRRHEVLGARRGEERADALGVDVPEGGQVRHQLLLSPRVPTVARGQVT